MTEGSLAGPFISAGAGLLGVALGGVITIWAHSKERRHARIREKLERFYSPLLGMRMQILAKSEVRQKVSGAANAAWMSLFQSVTDPSKKKQIDEDRWPDFESLIDYTDLQVRQDLIPLYRKMVELFGSNMELAEESTLTHFGALVEFTELWYRSLQHPIPPEVLTSLNHSEKKLYPLYDDLVTQFRRLRKQLG